MRGTPVTVVGTLVSATKSRRVGAEGSLVLNFRIVSNERRFDKVTETWMNGESLYLSVTCWRTLAENAASLVKGDPVIVSGKLRTREWTTEDGERHSVVELEASAVGPDLARCNATVRRPRREEEPAKAAPEGSDAPEAAEPPDQWAETSPSDEVHLSDLAEAARPLVPALV
jgi:single-strand DNA-binding protein